MKLSLILNYLKKRFGSKKVCLAFSGGVDSSLLAYLLRISGVNFTAVMIVNEFIPSDRIYESVKTARELNFNLKIVKVKPTEEMLENRKDRCYHCKKLIFSKISEFNCNIVDGTNASDLLKDRPGLKALKEFNVVSPFVELGITKKEVRSLAKSLGLDFYDKPSDSCLATRIEGKITKEKLEFIEVAERVCWKIVGKNAKKIRVKVNKSIKVEIII